MSLPKTLGACADRLHLIRDAKALLQKQIDELDEERKAIEAKLIEELPKSDAGGITGKLAKVVIIRDAVPQAEDWDAFYKYVLKTRDFSLLQRRLSTSAIAEQWEGGKKIPGVKAFQVVKVSVTKVK